MRVIFVGDAVASTGFARATHAVCDGLHAAGHEIHILGINYHADTHSYPYPIYRCIQPFDGGRDGFGVTRLLLLIERLEPNVVVLLNDPWNVNAYLQAIDGYVAARKEHGIDIRVPPVVGFLAVDASNQHGEPLNRLAHVVVWTKFAESELRRGGYTGEMSVVPLGVDLDVFYPRDKSESRKMTCPEDKVNDDSFIVGVVGRNQPRKRLDLAIQAFSMFAAHADNALLYLYVAPTGEQGCDIKSLAKYYGVTDRILLNQPHTGEGNPTNLLPYVYSSFDIMLSTSQGEGWGLPVLEAMACGVLCVVPSFAAFDAALGWTSASRVQLVSCNSTALSAPLNAYPYTIGQTVDVDELAATLKSLSLQTDVGSALARRGLALAQTLPWTRTAAEFRSVLESVVGRQDSIRQQADPK